MIFLVTANTSWYLYNFQNGLIKKLIHMGNEVIILAPHDEYSEKIQELGAEYIPLKLKQRSMNPAGEFLVCLQYYKHIRKLKPDWVLTFTIKCNLYVGICKRLLAFRHIANISGLGEAFDEENLLNRFISKIYPYALGKSDRVFFQNNEDMQMAVRENLVNQSIAHRLPGSGVNLTLFRPLDNYVPNKPLRFLMFGRFVPKKGYDLFLEVAAKMVAENKPAKFWVMGIEDRSRPESHRLFERIKQSDQRNIIKLLEPSDDVTSVLQQVDVVVLPSEYNEGVPRSLLEALACGKPIITTDRNGCKDTVDNGQNGYLMRACNKEELSLCMMKLINTSFSKLYVMGLHSREKAVRQFGEHKVIKAYLDAINSTSMPRHIVSKKHVMQIPTQITDIVQKAIPNSIKITTEISEKL